MKLNTNRGFSLIEVLLYIALLSILMTQIIGYAITVHQNDLKFSNEIQDEIINQ